MHLIITGTGLHGEKLIGKPFIKYSNQEGIGNGDLELETLKWKGSVIHKPVTLKYQYEIIVLHSKQVDFSQNIHYT